MSPELTRSLYELREQIIGFIYPNEIEIHWSILIVVYPYVTGLVAGAFILASLVKVFNVKELQPTYGCPSSRPWPSCWSPRSPSSSTSAGPSASTRSC
jgi:hypothetical protein